MLVLTIITFFLIIDYIGQFTKLKNQRLSCTKHALGKVIDITENTVSPLQKNFKTYSATIEYNLGDDSFVANDISAPCENIYEKDSEIEICFNPNRTDVCYDVKGLEKQQHPLYVKILAGAFVIMIIVIICCLCSL